MKRKERVCVAMSGGVDSSVAAALLVEQGYDVVGVTIRTWSEKTCSDAQDPRSCCSLKGVEDARAVADRLRIPFYVVDGVEEFEKTVIDYFVDGYARGVTPNPCVVCNEKIKFASLWRRAQAWDCQWIASGHYAQVEHDAGFSRLRRAADPSKDQSYVLFRLGAPMLRRTLLPIGSYQKNEVRSLARRFDLPVSEKPDSQELCFVQSQDIKRFLTERRPDAEQPGEVVGPDGQVIGRHNGAMFYTVGQRKGLGIAAGRPLYVSKVDPAERRVELRDRDQLYERHMQVEQSVWLIPSTPKSGDTIEASVKIRYNHPAAAARIHVNPDQAAEVEFDEPQWAVTPGQAAVFYEGDWVIGGGWIKAQDVR